MKESLVWQPGNLMARESPSTVDIFTHLEPQALPGASTGFVVMSVSLLFIVANKSKT